MKISIGLLIFPCWFLPNSFNGDWFITLWIASMFDGQSPAENFLSDNSDLVICITSLCGRAIAPSAHKLYSVVEWCLILTSSAKLVINGKIKWEPWSITDNSMQPKQRIHLDMALAASSRFPSLLEYKQQSMGGRIVFYQKYVFKLLSSGDPIYKNCICIASLDRSSCSAKAKGRGTHSLFLLIIQWMHACKNSVKFCSKLWHQ